jgi:hypothetical protein
MKTCKNERQRFTAVEVLDHQTATRKVGKSTLPYFKINFPKPFDESLFLHVKPTTANFDGRL